VIKKTTLGLLAFSLASTGVYAEQNSFNEGISESGVFIGLDVFEGESNLDIEVSGLLNGSNDMDFDQSGFRLKLGSKEKSGTRFQTYFKSEDFDDAFDEKVYGLGFDVLKTFSVGSDFSPFVLAGLGLDWTELEDTVNVDFSEDSLSAVLFKLGFGGLITISKNVEVQVGVDWQKRSWQDIEFTDGFNSITLEQSDTSTTYYAGVNFHF